MVGAQPELICAIRCRVECVRQESLLLSTKMPGPSATRKDLLLDAVVPRVSGDLLHGRVFALTLRSNFFIRLGFQLVSKERFPEKIWNDCDNCPKQDCCDEDAVLLEFSADG